MRKFLLAGAVLIATASLPVAYEVVVPSAASASTFDLANPSGDGTSVLKTKSNHKTKKHKSKSKSKKKNNNKNKNSNKNSNSNSSGGA